MRETVGGTLLATDDYVSSLLGPDITNYRDVTIVTRAKILIFIIFNEGIVYT